MLVKKRYPKYFIKFFCFTGHILRDHLKNLVNSHGHLKLKLISKWSHIMQPFGKFGDQPKKLPVTYSRLQVAGHL